MRTRGGICYPEVVNTDKKRRKVSSKTDAEEFDFFDALPDDLVLFILCKLSSTASCPPDFINVLITCKRLKGLGLNSQVLSKSSVGMLAVKAKKWSVYAHRFLKLCAGVGNVEACFILGMIRFYCLKYRNSGVSFLEKAANVSHAPALYSLAIIQFHGSGDLKTGKDLRAGVSLCKRAAVLGHVDALRELGYCLLDGYGVEKNMAAARWFLIQANARELASFLAASPSTAAVSSLLAWNPNRHAEDGGACPLLCDFGCNVPPPAPHHANQFLREWFADRPVLTGLCCHSGCGRPETRWREFRRCSCATVTYCSRACQALDWKLRHKLKCIPWIKK